MIYSKTCEYAIRALAYLALKETGGYTMIHEISREARVPRSYLAKIFQALVREGILESQRGPSGGFAFRGDPEQITLIQVLDAIDDSTVIEECVMGLDQCSSKNACPLHDVWVNAKEKILEKLKECRIVDLTDKVQALAYREMSRARLNPVLPLRSTTTKWGEQ